MNHLASLIAHPELTRPAIRRRLVFAAALVALLSLGGCDFDSPTVVEPMPIPHGEICEMPVIEGLAKDALPPGMGREPLPAPVVLTSEQRPSLARQTSHALAVRGGEVFVVDRDNDRLVVLDAKQLKEIRSVALVGRPEQLVLTQDGTAFVSLRHAGAIARIKPGAKTATQWAVGVAPIGLALSVDDKTLWVALSGEDRVIGVDVSTGATVRSMSVAARPRRVLEVPALDHTPRMLVVSHEWGRVTELKLDSSTGGAPTLGIPALHKLRSRNPTDGMAMMSEDSMGSTSTQQTGDRASRSVALTGLAGGGYLVGHTLQNRGSSGSSVGHGNLKKAPSGGYGGGGGCSPIPQRPMVVSATPRVASLNLVHFETFAPTRDPETQRDFLSRFDQPVDLIHHPKVSLAFLVATGTDNVLVLNTAVFDPILAPLASIHVGEGPRSIALSEDGATAYVLNGQSFTVSRIALAPLVDLAVVDLKQAKNLKFRLKQPLLMEHTAQYSYGSDPLSPLLRRGRRIFHHTPNPNISEASRFACASCHYEGGEDKKTWFVDGEPRQTPALAGRLLGTAPFNWKGSEHGLQKNMNKTISRMGGKGLNSEDLKALEAFLTYGLVPPPNPSHTAKQVSPAVQRGKDLFFDPKVGCGGCHTGGTGTNGKAFDVGVADHAERITVAQRMANASKQKVDSKTLKLPYDTPSLRGVWHTAPYFHNGRAATLREALKMTATTMGHTAHLNAGQMDDLLAYLKTL